MLSPRARQTLLTSLRPPYGFRVDAVIATTFTLDLTALLTAPLAFSLLDSASKESRIGSSEPGLDPYALLRSAREHVQRMIVFCDATHIATPAKYRPLFAYLEKCVIEVIAPHESGVFHPKVWVLKFVNDAAEVSYRLLCSSRNLTFDASWDTLLVLNGTLVDRKNAIAANRPLSDFVAALPALAKPGTVVSRTASKMVAEVADELLRVKFEHPEHVEELAFHPLGLEGYTRFRYPERNQRCLVVSPFVNAGGLEGWTSDGAAHILVSRLDQLDAVSDACLQSFKSQFVLADTAESPEDGDTEATAALEETATTGLHAKLFVVDDDKKAHVWTGSANATEAGFNKNVEFLVQMTGQKGALGVEQFLEKGLGALLKRYTRELIPPTPMLQKLELRLCRLRRHLAQANWTARVGEESASGFPLSLHCANAAWSETDSIQVRPITLSSQHAQVLSRSPGPAADFGVVSAEALTPFFTFHVTLQAETEELEADLVLQARLDGAPANREERAMATMLDDPGKVMRFLSMLLTDDALDWASDEEHEDGEGRGATAGVLQQALLERLLKALHSRPAQLDSIEAVMKELLRTDAGQSLLPEQLRDIWAPIYAARQASAGAGR